jgi:serine/threonine-protein kinase
MFNKQEDEETTKGSRFSNFTKTLKGSNNFNGDEGKQKSFKFIVITSFVAMMLMFVTAGIVYFIKLQPHDETIVPRVTAMPLVEALLTLQDNNLTATIETRSSDNPNEEGLVLAQRPRSGIHIRMGQSVALTVSRGSVLNIMEDFTGKTLEEVRRRLTTAYQGALVQIEEPIVYVINDAPMGTVIAQSPAPNSEINGPVTIKLTISRGLADSSLQVSGYLGLNYSQALLLLGEAGIPFQFESNGRRDGDGLVVAQQPSSGEQLAYGRPLILTISEPAETGLKQFGLAKFVLPDSPSPLAIQIVERTMAGSSHTLFKGNVPSSTLTIPYVSEVGNQIVLIIADRDVSGVTVE